MRSRTGRTRHKADEWDQGKHAWNKDGEPPAQPEQRIYAPSSPTSPPLPTMPKPEAKPEPSLISLMERLCPLTFPSPSR